MKLPMWIVEFKYKITTPVHTVLYRTYFGWFVTFSLIIINSLLHWQYMFSVFLCIFRLICISVKKVKNMKFWPEYFANTTKSIAICVDEIHTALHITIRTTIRTSTPDSLSPILPQQTLKVEVRATVHSHFSNKWTYRKK